MLRKTLGKCIQYHHPSFSQASATLQVKCILLYADLFHKLRSGFVNHNTMNILDQIIVIVWTVLYITAFLA